MTASSNKKQVLTTEHLDALNANLAYAKIQADRAAGVVEEFDRATGEFAGVLAQTAATINRIPWYGGDHTTLPTGAGDYLILRGPETGQVWTRDANGAAAYRNTGLESLNRADLPTVSLAEFGLRDGQDITLPFLLAMAKMGSNGPARGTLIIPPGNYLHGTAAGGTVDKRLMIVSTNGLVISGYGAVITAHTSLPAHPNNAGFWAVNAKNGGIEGVKYDGRLDARNALGGDGYGANRLHSFSVWEGCENFWLRQTISDRAMMDGYYVGITDGIYTSSRPKDILLDNVTATRSYRQGFSPVGVNGYTVRGGQFNDTGTIKGTAPMAGIDSEAHIQTGLYNDGGEIIGATTNGNMGTGLMLENGSRRTKVRRHKAKNNLGMGVSFTENAEECSVTESEIEGNGSIGDKTNVMIRGNGHEFSDNTVICNGIGGALSAPSGSSGRIIRRNKFKQTGTTLAGVIAGNIGITGTDDIFEYNEIDDVIVDRGFDQYAAIFDSPGGSCSNNKVRNKLAGNDAMTGGLFLKRARYADDNKGEGYKPVGGRQIVFLDNFYGGLVENARNNRDATYTGDLRGNNPSKTAGLPDVLPMIGNGSGSYPVTSKPTQGTVPKGYTFPNINAPAAPTAASPLGWVCTTGGITAAPWPASTAIPLGQQRTTAAGNTYVATVAGTTGTVPPAHTSGTAQDGTVTWQYVGAAFVLATYGVASTTLTPPGTPPSIIYDSGTTGTLSAASTPFKLIKQTPYELMYILRATWTPSTPTGTTVLKTTGVSGLTSSLMERSVADSNTGRRVVVESGGVGADRITVENTNPENTARSVTVTMTMTYSVTPV